MKRLVLVLIVSFFISCTGFNDDQAGESFFTESEQQALVALQKTTVTPIDQVEVNAKSMMKVFDDGKDRQVKEVISFDYELPGTGVRGSGVPGNTIPLYIYNFADSSGDDAGFALIAGDDRVNGSLAMSPTGTLGREVENPGLAVFLSRIPGYLNTEIDNYNKIVSENLDVIYSKLKGLGTGTDADINIHQPILMPPSEEILADPEAVSVTSSVSYTAWQDVLRYDPLTSVRWSQGSPENDKIPKNCGKDDTGKTIKAPAGCGPVAAAIFMSSQKFPYKYGDHVYAWETLISKEYAFLLTRNYLNQLQRLMRDLGSLMKADYTCDSTGVSGEDLSLGLRSMGYNTPSWNDYKLTKIITSLKNSRPIITSGYSKKDYFLFFFLVYGEGHFWNIDGYLKQTRIKTTTVTSVFDDGSVIVKDYKIGQNRYLVHCNWGWLGSGNGYFNNYVFDANHPVIPDRSYEKYNYQYEITILPDIKRK
jgi:hypothetical protein